MHDWILQENHNTKIIVFFYVLKKVICNDKHGVNILCILTHLSHIDVKPLNQVASKVGMALPISTLEPVPPISIPNSSISTYVPPIVTTFFQVSNPLSSFPIPSFLVSVSPSSLSTS